MNNVAPTVSAITAPAEPLQVNTALNTSANFTDLGVLDTHTAVWDWGDGTTSPGTVNETSGSGSASDSHSYTTPGTYNIKLTVTDKDGGSGQSNLTVTVVNGSSGTYDFSGFFPPVDNLPTFNLVKAGSAIPVKFSLHGDQGLAIFAPNSPGSAATNCDPNASVDPIDQTVSAGSSNLTYDQSTDTYTYVWKTNKSWKGCRQFTVTLSDGTQHKANFQFK